MIRLFALIVTAMLVSHVADARAPQNGGPNNPGPSAPSAPSAPSVSSGPTDSDGSAQRTNYAFVEDGSTHRKVVSDFCYNWRSDRFCVKN